MMSGQGVDRELEARLAALTTHDAGPEHVERVRAQCLSVLAHRRHRAGAGRRAAAQWRARLEMAVATGLGILYLAGAAERALEVLR